MSPLHPSSPWPARWWPLLLLAGLAVVYLPGLHHALVFDDARLADGTIFGVYGGVLELKQRLLSYGSFVWVEWLAGPGVWKQRLVNLGLHAGVAFGLYALWDLLSRQAAWPQDVREAPQFDDSRRAAVRVAVLLFALNPVAVHAVAYLVQRSIVAATLFTVLACWCFAHGLLSRRVGWYAAAVLAYVAALGSKEHALMTPALWVALYVYLCRPPARRLAWLALACVALLGVFAALLAVRYRGVLGVAFDAQSRAHLAQLATLNPQVAEQAWGLSMLNQAALFLRYGLLWVLPNVQWMSIDLRPAFPVSWTSPWHLAGALTWLALWIAAAWMLLRGRGLAPYTALCLLFPLLLHLTEFATVWVQDPFVLYRSYLWAIGLPGLAVLLFAGARPRTVYGIGLVFAVAWTALAAERVWALRTPLAAWSDAAEKIDLQAPPNAVGRWRPYLNRGGEYLVREEPERAYGDFAQARALGEPAGAAAFNMGMALQLLGRHAQAVEQFDQALSMGLDNPMLHAHRGESRLAAGQAQAALDDFDAALARIRDPAVRRHVQARRADAAMQARDYEQAVDDFADLIAADEQDLQWRIGLGMAYIGRQDGARARQIFEALVREHPGTAAYYGRGAARALLGDWTGAVADLDRALALEPGNAQLRALRSAWAAQAIRSTRAPPRTQNPAPGAPRTDAAR